MKSAVSIACALAFVVLAPHRDVAAAAAAQGVLDPFAHAWAKVDSYTCTITAREISGSKVQDRVYQMYFQKPHNTRLNITGGDGRGSAAVWQGGDTVTGHQGGWLSMVKLNLNIHAHLATSLRGTTIADANFGAILDHLTGLKSTTATAQTEADKTTVTLPVSDPDADGGVTQEVIVLGKDGLPAQYDQYEGTQQVKHVVYSDVNLNATIPASTWSI